MDYKDEQIKEKQEDESKIETEDDAPLEIHAMQDLIRNNIDSPDIQQYSQALDALNNLLDNDDQIAIKYIFDNQIVTKIVQNINFEYPDTVLLGFSVISDIIDCDEFDELIYDFFPVLSGWVENSTTIEQSIEILKICAYAIKKHEKNLALIISAGIVDKIWEKTRNLPLPTQENHELDAFYEYLYYFLEMCYKYELTQLPLNFQQEFIKYIFFTIPNISIELLGFILRPLLNAAKNNILPNMFFDNIHVFLNVLGAMQEIGRNSEDHELPSSISLQIVSIFSYLFDNKGISREEVEELNLIDCLHATLDIYSDTIEPILISIAKLIQNKAIANPDLPFGILESEIEFYSHDAKSAVAFLFHETFNRLPKDATLYLYDHLDLLDKMLEILSAQNPKDVEAITGALNIVIFNADILGLDKGIILAKLEEYDIDNDFFYEMIDNYPQKERLVEACEKFLKTLEDGIGSDADDDSDDEYYIPSGGFVFSLSGN